jgi:hypothetical protein
MNISKRVIEQLEQLVSKGPEETEAVVLDSAQQQGYIVGVTAEAEGLSMAEGLRVSLALADYDRYSVALRNLQVAYYKDSPQNGDKVEAYLRQRAEQITQRLTYLAEPLELLELDAEAGLVQLRSRAPQQEGEERVYWEAMLQARPHPTVSLTRYRWTPDGSEREPFVYPITFVTLGRIVQDLADTLVGKALR